MTSEEFKDKALTNVLKGLRASFDQCLGVERLKLSYMVTDTEGDHIFGVPDPTGNMAVYKAVVRHTMRDLGSRYVVSMCEVQAVTSKRVDGASDAEEHAKALKVFSNPANRKDMLICVAWSRIGPAWGYCASAQISEPDITGRRSLGEWATHEGEDLDMGGGVMAGLAMPEDN